MAHEDSKGEHYSDAVALVTNDIRRLLINAGLDPHEDPIYRVTDIIAKAIQGGAISKYN